MEIADLVLRYLDVILSWPLAAIVISTVFMCKFQSAISQFLGRLVRGEAYGVRLEAATPSEQTREIQQAQSMPEKPESGAVNENAQLKSAYEAVVRLYLFERAYNLIYGSQVALLEHLEKRGEVGDHYFNLAQYYEKFRQTSGLQNVQFKDYLEFLRASGFVMINGENVTIAQFGRDFLHHVRTFYANFYQTKPY